MLFYIVKVTQEYDADPKSDPQKSPSTTTDACMQSESVPYGRYAEQCNVY